MKLMTQSYIFLVSVTASLEMAHVAPIFRDVIFILILVTGVGMSLTLDDKRPDVPGKATFKYISFSIFASVFFSILSIAAYIHFDFGKFWFYVLIGTTASLAPQFARKVLPEAPDELKKGAFQILGAFFSGIARKFDNNIKNEENDTPRPDDS